MSEIDFLRGRLQGIYSETTIDHIVNPRNSLAIPNPDGFAELRSCDGESLKIWLKLREGAVADSGFWTNGCAATIACASMSTELVKGRSVTGALAITASDIARELVDLPPGNFHCAELAERAMRAALMDCISTQRQPWKKLYR